MFVKYYIIVRAGMSKHMQVCGMPRRNRHVVYRKRNLCLLLTDVQFFLTELLKYVQTS
jgi:hypothetical protein